MPDARKRAVIIGGSIAGLFAGLFLRRAGWEVTIFERSPRGLEGRGTGIVTHGELHTAMTVCGIEDISSLGVTVLGRVVLARDGSVIEEYQLPQMLTSWSVLHRALLSRFPEQDYRLGMALERYNQDSQSITAYFSNGSSETCDLLVGADGIHSAVRGQYLPSVKPAYAGYVAWRGLVPECDLTGATRASLMNRFGFCLPEGEQMLGYPVAVMKDATAPGRRHYNFVWYRPAGQETDMPRLYSPVGGIRRPPKDQLLAEAIAAMRADAPRLLAPQFAEIVARTREPFVQAIYDLESPRLVDGRAALIGDAAFVARPHVGMGVTKAAGDAAALAKAVDGIGDLSAALSRFEYERLGLGRTVLAQARRLGAYMQAQIGSLEERSMAERYRSPSNVIAETASVDFLSMPALQREWCGESIPHPMRRQ
jgi:2-polyprenyl-6-methoxyphenol hydroxylase-like FAD-dependent oxidoreductase